MMFSFSTCRFVLLVAAACHSVISAAKEPTVELLGAGDFAILAKSGITNVPASSITGDIGVSPIAAAAMTGFEFTMDSALPVQFATSEQVVATNATHINYAYAADFGGTTAVILTTSVGAMETAYTDAAGHVNLDAARINL